MGRPLAPWSLLLAMPAALIGQRLPATSDEILRQYDARNTELSTPVPQPYSAPYFTDNERRSEQFYSRFEHAGGVMIGVEFQQNFTYLVHGRPALYVFFDINPDVTEILVPFFGQLMVESRERREFLSALTGVAFTKEDVTRLLEPRRPPGRSAEELGSYLAGVVAEILGRVPKEERRRRFEARIGRVLAHRSVTAAHREQILKWFEFLEEDMLTAGRFFQQSALAAWVAGDDPSRRRALAGWLSTEDSYRMVRRYWTEGRIAGVTGDIAGPSAGKLAQWLRARPDRSPVTFLYLSNVGASIMGHEKPAYFSALYRNLGQLPLAPNAVTLIAQGANVAYLRSYARARTFYDSLSSVETGVMMQLVETPLSYSVLGNAQDALRKFKEGVPRDRPDYAALLDRLSSARSEVQGLSPEAFEQWVQREWPRLETRSEVFQALVAVLAELGILQL